jgi:hypothetical protein
LSKDLFKQIVAGCCCSNRVLWPAVSVRRLILLLTPRPDLGGGIIESCRIEQPRPEVSKAGKQGNLCEDPIRVKIVKLGESEHERSSADIDLDPWTEPGHDNVKIVSVDLDGPSFRKRFSWPAAAEVSYYQKSKGPLF